MEGWQERSTSGAGEGPECGCKSKVGNVSQAGYLAGLGRWRLRVIFVRFLSKAVAVAYLLTYIKERKKTKENGPFAAQQ